MNLFSTFLSKNKRNWLMYMTDNVESYDIKMHLIIKEFFIFDNISYEKYIINSSWDFKRFSIYSDENDVLKCTYTFKKYFSQDLDRKLSNKDIGINSWFYYGYPDVAHWIEESLDVEQALKIDKNCFIEEKDRKVLIFFRNCVNEFKRTHKKLECGL